MNYLRKGNVGYVSMAANSFTFETNAIERSEIEQRAQDKRSFTDWESLAFTVGDYDVIPFGEDNNLPIEIRNTVNEHNLAPRIFTKKKFLLWGEGPQLYMSLFQDGKPYIEYKQDDEVIAWLESWDFEMYLRKAIEDFNHSEGVFSKLFLSKASRIGPARVSKIEHVGVHLARLAVPKGAVGQPPSRILVGQWHKNFIDKFQSYPVFNKQNPAQHSVSMHYAHMYGFSSDYYARPDVVGSLAWIRRATAIPFILEAYSNNSLNMKYHIESPASYWEAKEEAMKERCTLNGQQYDPQSLEDLKDAVYTDLAKVLAGEKNVGKFFQSEAFYQIVGATAIKHGWTITPIEQKIKEYVDAQLAISERGDVTTTGGLGLHKALSYVGGESNDSGSEQLYAYKNHILSEVKLPESIICEAINMALKINWPAKKLKLGFYRQLPEKEQDVTSSKRIKNVV